MGKKLRKKGGKNKEEPNREFLRTTTANNRHAPVELRWGRESAGVDAVAVA